MIKRLKVICSDELTLKNDLEELQGRSQDFVFGGAKRKFGGASLKIFKILNIGLRNFYVMFK